MEKRPTANNSWSFPMMTKIAENYFTILHYLFRSVGCSFASCTTAVNAWWDVLWMLWMARRIHTPTPNTKYHIFKYPLGTVYKTGIRWIWNWIGDFESTETSVFFLGGRAYNFSAQLCVLSSNLVNLEFASLLTLNAKQNYWINADNRFKIMIIIIINCWCAIAGKCH